MAFAVEMRRVYDAAAGEGGETVLVDRLWPRGISRERASWGSWLREVAPSTALRKWYGHDPALRDEFERRYREELASVPAAAEALARLRALGEATGRLTLVTSVREVALSHVAVLRKVLAGE